MPLSDAFAEHEARYRAAVMEATWGHLAPEPRRVYTGYILFAYGAYGGIVPIQCEFDGLNNSPWFFDDLIEYIDQYVEQRGVKGSVYRFDGTYVKFKNGGCRFSGKVTQLISPKTAS